jgi:hypothetical protein
MSIRPDLKTTLASALLLGAIACSSQTSLSQAPPHAAAFHVGIFGDMPYVAEGEDGAAKQLAYVRSLESLSASPLAFAVHIGDIGVGGACSDSIYSARAAEFSAFAHPLVLLFGDNEWTDCKSPFDPLDRLAALRRRFAAPGTPSLGSRSIPLSRQSDAGPFPEFSENVRWRRGNVLFLAVHAVGSNNNWGNDSTPSAEYTRRNAANLRWLEESFAEAARDKVRGVAIFMHANPLRTSAARPVRPNGFTTLNETILRLALAFGGPVALVHGDSHYFRVDKPYFVQSTGRSYARITRAETFGDPNSHWLRMTIDPSDPNLFSFDPVLVAGNVDFTPP